MSTRDTKEYTITLPGWAVEDVLDALYLERVTLQRDLSDAGGTDAFTSSLIGENRQVASLIKSQTGKEDSDASS